MKSKISDWLSVLVALVAFVAFSVWSKTKVPTIEFPGSVLKIEVADTPAERATGLSNRASLDPGWGMVFVFDQPNLHSLWMKDMRFNLDLIWLDQSGKVISLHSDVAPATYPASFSPAEPALYAVEVPAGYVRTVGLTVGDQVTLNL